MGEACVWKFTILDTLCKLICPSELCSSILYSAVEMSILQRWGQKNLGWRGGRRCPTDILMSPARAKRLKLPLLWRDWQHCTILYVVFNFCFFSVFYTTYLCITYKLSEKVIFYLLLWKISFGVLSFFKQITAVTSVDDHQHLKTLRATITDK